MPIEIHGAGGGGGSSSIGYAVCSTAAATAQKTVTVPDFELKTGYHLSVIFNNEVGENATLNVNGTGNKYIRWRGVNLKPNAIPTGNTCKLVYNGNYWYLLSSDSLAASGGGSQFERDSWATIASRNDYKTAYKIGDTKDITLSTGERITMRIEDFDHDNLTSGGKSRISMLMKNCLNENRGMNSSGINVGGMNASEMQGWLSNDFYNQLPSDLIPLLKPVNKITSAGGKSSNLVTNSVKIWLPTFTEMNFPPNPNYSPGGEGTPYPLFTDDTSRIKTANGSEYYWWSSSPRAASANDFVIVWSGGFPLDNPASSAAGVAAGFNL